MKYGLTLEQRFKNLQASYDDLLQELEKTKEKLEIQKAANRELLRQQRHSRGSAATYMNEQGNEVTLTRGLSGA